jgi:cytochrome c
MRLPKTLILTSLAVLLSVTAAAQEKAQETMGRAAGPEDGQILFNNACRTCHTLREGDNRLGPNLNKIVGRKAGSLPGYGYSSAMKGGDFTWDEATLDRFIANPDQAVPGHNMKPYGGLASADDRNKIIAYLRDQK